MTARAGIEGLWQDLRFAARVLGRNRGYAAAAVVTLALGIGANTAIFSVVEAVLLRPLPYASPDRLAVLGDAREPEIGVLYTDYEGWRAARPETFSDLAAFYRNSGWSRVTLNVAGEPREAQAGFVSASFFPLLGVKPLLGHWFSAGEETRRERLVLLSHALWKRDFGASPAVLGKTLELDGRSAQVIGVMPDTFRFPGRDTELWAPITTHRLWQDPALARDDGSHSRGFYTRWGVIGRIAAGRTTRQAEAEMAAISRRLAESAPDPHHPRGVRVLPLRVEVAGDMRLALLVLFAAVACVLLIACVNVANLVLAHGAARAEEKAIRAALGAGRGRLVRQVFAESLALALPAACLGLVLALLAVRALIAFAPPALPRLEEARLDGSVLAFTLLLSVGAALLCGLVPASRVTRAAALAFGRWEGGSGARSPWRARHLLVVAELALSLVLLASAALLLRSFVALHAVDPGFRPERLLTLRVTLPTGTATVRREALAGEVLERVRALPGVRAAGAIDGLFELEAKRSLGLRAVEGHSPEPPERWTALTWTTVAGDTFDAMGAPLLRGRSFSPRDGRGSPLVAIIDQAAARRYWPGEDPIGKRFKGQDARGARDEYLTVIGVVGNMRREGLGQRPTPHIFQWREQAGGVTPDFVVRTDGDPGALSAALRRAVREVAPTAIASPVTTMEQQLSEQLSPQRFQTGLLALFSLVALVLAGVGVYGVMHYSVTRRSYEIGLRVALGARPADVLRLVLGEGLGLAAVGLLLGLLGALAATRILASLLFATSTTDPLAFGGVSLALLAVALGACHLPARKALNVEPMVALRHQA